MSWNDKLSSDTTDLCDLSRSIYEIYPGKNGSVRDILIRDGGPLGYPLTCSLIESCVFGHACQPRPSQILVTVGYHNEREYPIRISQYGQDCGAFLTNADLMCGIGMVLNDDGLCMNWVSEEITFPIFVEVVVNYVRLHIQEYTVVFSRLLQIQTTRYPIDFMLWRD